MIGLQQSYRRCQPLRPCAASPPEVRVAIESADCLLCIGVRFTDTATGFFSHRLRSEAPINIRAFDVTAGTTYVPGVAGWEVLNALVKAVRVKPRRTLPPRFRPRTRLPSQFRQSLTQDRFWQRMQDFIRPGDVVLADIGTSSAGTAGLRMPNGVAVIGQPLWAAVGYALPALLGTLLAAPRRRQLLFIGDGAFQMTVQELSTILRRALKPIIFLVNNNGSNVSFSAQAPVTMISINGDMPKPLLSSTLKVKRSLTGSAPKTNWRTLWRQQAIGKHSC